MFYVPQPELLFTLNVLFHHQDDVVHPRQDYEKFEYCLAAGVVGCADLLGHVLASVGFEPV